MKNLLQNIPDQLPEERFETLVKNENIHIERIVSKGHASPKEGWYDQDRNEWVLLLKGAARLAFEDGSHPDLKILHPVLVFLSIYIKTPTAGTII